ncbi:hypothetical protein GQ53DRAFT_826656 [Thozetella sp. PMI_491]|nr:hypothetical protein GQ53DRAFT_826656 [Thozetella sp. PMI_491]
MGPFARSATQRAQESNAGHEETNPDTCGAAVYDLLHSRAVSSKKSQARAIAQALWHHRKNRGGDMGGVGDNNHDDSTAISPERFLALFSEAASKSLTAFEVEGLVSGLRQPPRTINAQTHLRQLADQRIRRFYDEEPRLNRESPSRLAAPSGPPDAEICLLMHCQTKDGRIEQFWDENNQTICALQAKGFSPQFVFYFDLHWRAARPGRQNRGCPAGKWPPAVRLLHDSLTADLLELLPFHLLLVFGSCPQKFHRGIARENCHLQFSIAPLVELDMILQIRPGGSIQIVAYVPHPAHPLYNKSNCWDSCIILDSVANFYLWLVNRSYDRRSFARIANETPKGIPDGAPLRLLSAYRSEEKSLCRNLREQDYERAFWLWARQFLGEDPADVLGRGESVAEVINDKMNYLRYKG